jgi:hypothetical protein
MRIGRRLLLQFGAVGRRRNGPGPLAAMCACIASGRRAVDTPRARQVDGMAPATTRQVHGRGL